MKRQLSSLTVMILGILLMAPTVGDIGSCGKTATLLDRDEYDNARKLLDCQRCTECNITNQRCTRACDPSAPPDVELPDTCQPLYHDGEVCLNALQAASCDTFATYVDDVAPSSPTECDFCRVTPTPTPSFSDAGIAGFEGEAGP